MPKGSRLPLMLGFITALTGAVVIVGWVFDIPALKSISPDFVTMKFNTALSFLLLGVSISLLCKEPGKMLPKNYRIYLGQALAAVVALIGIVTLAEYIFGIYLRIDQIFFKEPLGAVGTYSPGRMSPATALNFLILGVALFFIDADTPKGHRPCQFLAFVSGAISFVAILGYLYSTRALYSVAAYTSMALHTAVAFLIASVGILFLRAGYGFMDALLYKSPAASLARNMLFFVIFVNPIAGYVILVNEQKGFYGAEFGIALLIVVNIAIFTMLIFLSVFKHHSVDIAFREAEEKVRLLSRAVEQSASMVIMTDKEGNIKYVNQRFTEVTGYGSDEVIGKNPRILKSGKQPPEFYKKLWNDITSGRDWHGEFHNRKKNGVIYWVACTISSVKDVKGAISRFLAVHEDITERKRLEEELARKQEDILTANENLRRLAQTKAEFVSVVSHELRTPLTSIKEAISLILDGAAGKMEKQQERFLTIAKNNIDRLAFLINDILDFSKLEAGRMPMRRTKGDINKVIDEIFETFHMQAQVRGIAIHLLLAEGLPQVWVDMERMSQVMANLLSNAIKFTPDNGWINIKSWRESFEDKDWVLVSVEDSGPGIADEDIPKLFERFAQLDTTMTRKPGGTGLGLAISKNILELHGGDIWVESKLGAGSKFTFRVPIYKKDVEFNFVLDEAIERAKINRIKASIIAFKVKDAALARMEEIIKQAIRSPEDKIVRYKEGELIAVLATTDKDGALKIVSRVSERAKHEQVSFDAKVIVYPDDGATKEELIAKMS